MEIGWTDVGSGGYILVSSAHSNTSVESRFGQKVWSTFPIAQYRIASPFQLMAPLLFVYKNQIQTVLFEVGHIYKNKLKL